MTSEELENLEEFRLRAKTWVKANLAPLNGADPFVGHARDEMDQVVRAKAIQQRLFEGGFAGLCYPREYGGQSFPPSYQAAFNEVSRDYELPHLFNTPTLTIILPHHPRLWDQREQKRRIIPAALAEKDLWVQFLSGAERWLGSCRGTHSSYQGW